MKTNMLLFLFFIYQNMIVQIGDKSNLVIYGLIYNKNQNNIQKRYLEISFETDKKSEYIFEKYKSIILIDEIIKTIQFKLITTYNKSIDNYTQKLEYETGVKYGLFKIKLSNNLNYDFNTTSNVNKSNLFNIEINALINQKESNKINLSPNKLRISNKRFGNISPIRRNMFNRTSSSKNKLQFVINSPNNKIRDFSPESKKYFLEQVSTNDSFDKSYYNKEKNNNSPRKLVKPNKIQTQNKGSFDDYEDNIHTKPENNDYIPKTNLSKVIMNNLPIKIDYDLLNKLKNETNEKTNDEKKIFKRNNQIKLKRTEKSNQKE